MSIKSKCISQAWTTIATIFQMSCINFNHRRYILTAQTDAYGHFLLFGREFDQFYLTLFHWLSLRSPPHGQHHLFQFPDKKLDCLILQLQCIIVIVCTHTKYGGAHCFAEKFSLFSSRLICS